MIEFFNVPAETEKIMRAVYDAALSNFGQEDVLLLEAGFAGPDEMRAVNAEARGVDAVTDVLSFPAFEAGKRFPLRPEDRPEDADPETGLLIVGSVLMCPERIRSQAAEYGNTEEGETARLFAHGLLHLFGFDHAADGEEAEMRAEEEKILSLAGYPS